MNQTNAENQRQERSFVRLPKLRRLSRRDIFQILISLISAIFLWAYISTNISSDFSRQIFKIPVKVSLEGTKAERFELSLLPTEKNAVLDTLTVTATLKGNRAALGALTPSDVEVYVDFDSDSLSDTAGIQRLPLKLKTLNGAKYSDCELTVDSVEVEMDHYENRTVPVEVDYSTLTVEGETRISTDKVSVDPAEVQVYGPSTKLSQLERIRVNVASSEPLTQEKIFSDISDYTMLDKNGNPVSGSSMLTVQSTPFSVRIPVFYRKKLPVTVKIKNIPDGFDAETVLKRIRLSVNGESFPLPDYCADDEEPLSISIETDESAKKAELDGCDSWEIAEIPLSDFSVKMKPISVPIIMDTGYTDSSQLGTVYVSLDDTDLIAEPRWIHNNDIVQMNGNRLYNYELESPGGNTPVTLIGTAEDLEKIGPDDLRASITLINIPVTSDGVYPTPFTVTLPDNVSTVWVSPAPTVNIMVTSAQNP